MGHGSQKIVAAGFILERGKVLLARRAATKALAPGKFHLPGGHVEFGETVQAALAREIMEEFGIRVEVGEPFFAFSYMAGGVHTVGVACLARLGEPEGNIRVKADETDEYLWAAAGELL